MVAPVLRRYLRRTLQAAVIGGAVYVASKATKQILALADENSDGSSAAKRDTIDTEAFVNAHGLLIRFRSWLPAGKPKAILILCHGFGEHVGRYETLGQAFADAGFAVYALDHQGHGGSEGTRAYTRSFDDFVTDVLKLASIAKDRFRDCKKMFILGHSMGGAIATLTAMKEPALWSAVVLSGPALAPDPKVATPNMVAIARFLSGRLPKLKLDPLPAEEICSDPTVVRDYVRDPLVYHEGMRARMAVNFLSFFDYIDANASKFTLPVLVMHGTEDKLTRPEGSAQFFEAVGTPQKDKQIILYPGLKHEIFKETLGRDENGVNQPLRDAIDWLNARCS
eukprot:TRINITY_DN9013_c0_g2_i1.p1 TRINITY_DN9013_c0_g2~~TRINITY_DN9013_c0_g2_i1.p1  ORF type:complete len:338 (-),score=51.87 TRINITY_DN9013_c0_g2_i1:111-1124(-)